jgi:hypothetical protein
MLGGNPILSFSWLLGESNQLEAKAIKVAELSVAKNIFLEYCFT